MLLLILRWVVRIPLSIARSFCLWVFVVPSAFTRILLFAIRRIRKTCVVSCFLLGYILWLSSSLTGFARWAVRQTARCFSLAVCGLSPVTSKATWHDSVRLTVVGHDRRCLLLLREQHVDLMALISQLTENAARAP